MGRGWLFAAACVALAPQAWAAGPREGFQAALPLSAPIRALEAERAVLAARRERAAALLPGAAAVTLAYRTDAVLRNRGLREYEGEFGVPLWLPGEARALGASADAEAAALEARVARERLELAGEVRNDWWLWREALAVRDSARTRVAHARGLERELGRQVGGGVLPRTDLLAATAAVREAEVVLRGADRALRQAAVVFRALTGLEPSDAPPEAEATPAAGDPRLLAAAAAVEAGRAAEALARVRSRANPEVALQLRHERDAFNESYGSRLAVLFTVPLGHAPVQRERLATAQATTTGNLAAVGLAERTVSGALDRARAARDAAVTFVESAEARHAALAEQTALFEAAWRGGEIPLIEVVRARAALASADSDRARARVALARTASTLNQALGIEPR